MKTVAGSRFRSRRSPYNVFTKTAITTTLLTCLVVLFWLINGGWAGGMDGGQHSTWSTGKSPKLVDAQSLAVKAGDGDLSSTTGGSGSDATESTSQPVKKGFMKENECATNLTEELAQEAAQNGLIMMTVANKNQIAFLRNWIMSTNNVGINYRLVASLDAETEQVLVNEGIPCFKYTVRGVVNENLLAWGDEGWRVMTWQHVFINQMLLGWGFDVIASDLDVAWLRNPSRWRDMHPADILFSHDGVWCRNENPGPEDLDVEGSIHINLNTGVYLARANDRTREFFNAWVDHFSQSRDHDQIGMYTVLRNKTQPLKSHPNSSYVTSVWGDRLWLGAFPVYSVANGHSYLVSELHKLLNTGPPYAVHAVWTYNRMAGKISRMREGYLWHDPVEYYTSGNFLTVELDVPSMPGNYNEIEENEPLISFHLDALQYQLEQAAVGMAIAAATGRIFIMPNFICFCERIWHPPIRCRMPGAEKMQFPVNCPADYYFHMERFEDELVTETGNTAMPIPIRERSFLENVQVPLDLKNSQATIRFVSESSKTAARLNLKGCVKACAANPSVCHTNSACIRGGTARKNSEKDSIDVVAGLADAHLVSVLKKADAQARVWKLDFRSLSSPWKAFGGFSCQAKAQGFDKRMDRLLQEWCCRTEEDAAKYNKPVMVLLHMLPDEEKFENKQPALQNIQGLSNTSC